MVRVDVTAAAVWDASKRFRDVTSTTVPKLVRLSMIDKFGEPDRRRVLDPNNGDAKLDFRSAFMLSLDLVIGAAFIMFPLLMVLFQSRATTR